LPTVAARRGPIRGTFEKAGELTGYGRFW